MESIIRKKQKERQAYDQVSHLERQYMTLARTMVGGYLAGRSSETQVGMASTCASMFKLAKYARDWRLGVLSAAAAADGALVSAAVWSLCCGGSITRCGVESHLSLVQRLIKSPKLITKPFSTNGASCHWPSRSFTLQKAK